MRKEIKELEEKYNTLSEEEKKAFIAENELYAEYLDWKNEKRSMLFDGVLLCNLSYSDIIVGSKIDRKEINLAMYNMKSIRDEDEEYYNFYSSYLTGLMWLQWEDPSEERREKAQKYMSLFEYIYKYTESVEEEIEEYYLQNPEKREENDYSKKEDKTSKVLKAKVPDDWPSQ